MYKIDLLVAKSWDELPRPWRQVNVAKKNIPKWTSLMDEAVVKLFEPYVNTDTLRPSMNGLHVDDKCYVATNAHQLLIVGKSGNTQYNNGTYLISSKIAKKNKKKVGDIINEKFPDYRVILNDSVNFTDSFDGRILKTYCEAMLKGEYVSPISKSIKFEIEYGKYVFLNAYMVIDMVNTFQQLGIETIHVGFNQYNRGVYFSNNRQFVSSPKNSINNPDVVLVLLMPLIENDADTLPFGATNINAFSTNTSSRVYFSFTHGAVYNDDKTKAVVDLNLKDRSVDYIDDVKLKLLKRLAGKNTKIPITDYVKVENGVAVATNLKEQISIKGVEVEDGIYQLLFDAFKNTTYKLDNFPTYLENLNFVELTQFKKDELQYVINEAKEFVSEDELRPALTGITFASSDETRIAIYSSNSSIMYSNSLYVTNPTRVKNSILYPHNLSFFLDNVNTYLVKLKKTESNDYFMFEFSDSNISYITKDSQAVPPDFKSVIKPSTDRELFVDKNALKNINDLFTKEDIKNGKILLFEFPSDDFQEVFTQQNLKISKGEYDKTNQRFVIDMQLGVLPYKISPKTVMGWDNTNLAIIMPITSNSSNMIGFNPSYLREVLSVQQDDNGIYFHSGKLNGQFLVSLNFKGQPQTKPTNQSQNTQRKADIQKIMKGLEILVKRGNKIAETKLKAYAIIIKRI